MRGHTRGRGWAPPGSSCILPTRGGHTRGRNTWRASVARTMAGIRRLKIYMQLRNFFSHIRVCKKKGKKGRKIYRWVNGFMFTECVTEIEKIPASTFTHLHDPTSENNKPTPATVRRHQLFDRWFSMFECALRTSFLSTRLPASST